MGTSLNILSAITAILAASLWFISAAIKIPNDIGVYDNSTHRRPKDAPVFMGLGGSLIASDFHEKTKTLLHALQKQSKLSAGAAICAGISALCQFIAYICK